jgi:hypothetical protein
MNVMGGDKVSEWKRIDGLASLIVTPERCAEIMRKQPESESRGRPGIIHSDPHGSKRVRETDDDPEPTYDEQLTESWRVSFGGFEGQEDELADEEVEVVGVAADLGGTHE